MKINNSSLSFRSLDRTEMKNLIGGGVAALELEGGADTCGSCSIDGGRTAGCSRAFGGCRCPIGDGSCG